MKYIGLILLCVSSVFAADTIAIAPTSGQNVCVVTITLDVTSERAAAIAQLSGGATLAQVKTTYALALIPRLYTIIETTKAGSTQTDNQINAARDAAIAQITATAAAQIAARATVGNPTN